MQAMSVMISSIKWCRCFYKQAAGMKRCPVERMEKDYAPDNDYTRLLFAVSMGNCTKGLGRLSEAEQHYLQALTIAERTRQTVERANILLLIAELNVHLKRFDKAEEYIERLLTQSGGLAITINLSEISLLRFKIDSATGNYVAAIRHYQHYKLFEGFHFYSGKSEAAGRAADPISNGKKRAGDPGPTEQGKRTGV